MTLDDCCEDCNGQNTNCEFYSNLYIDDFQLEECHYKVYKGDREADQIRLNKYLADMAKSRKPTDYDFNLGDKK